MLDEWWECFLLRALLILTMWAFPTPTTSSITLRQPTGCLRAQFSPDAIHSRLVQTLGLKAQPHKTVPTSDTSPKSQVVTCTSD